MLPFAVLGLNVIMGNPFIEIAQGMAMGHGEESRYGERRERPRERTEGYIYIYIERERER